MRAGSHDRPLRSAAMRTSHVCRLTSAGLAQTELCVLAGWRQPATRDVRQPTSTSSSDDHNALMPSISITPVVLIVAVDGFDNQLQIESKAAFNQCHNPAGIGAKRR